MPLTIWRWIWPHRTGDEQTRNTHSANIDSVGGDCVVHFVCSKRICCCVWWEIQMFCFVWRYIALFLYERPSSPTDKKMNSFFFLLFLCYSFRRRFNYDLCKQNHFQMNIPYLFFLSSALARTQLWDIPKKLRQKSVPRDIFVCFVCIESQSLARFLSITQAKKASRIATAFVCSYNWHQVFI